MFILFLRFFHPVCCFDVFLLFFFLFMLSYGLMFYFYGHLPIKYPKLYYFLTVFLFSVSTSASLLFFAIIVMFYLFRHVLIHGVSEATFHARGLLA